MSGVLHKVKNALQAEKNTPEAAAANQGNNEYGHASHATGHDSIGSGLPSGLEGKQKGSQLPGLERGEHIGSSGPQAAIAQSSHISPTNPGVLHSTKPGIHGERDSGTSGYHGLESEGTANTGYSRDDARVKEGAATTGAGASAAGLAEHEKEKHKHPVGHHDKSSTTTNKPAIRDDTTTSSRYQDQRIGEEALVAGATGAGAAGVAEHEKHKHQDRTHTPTTTSRTTDPQYPSETSYDSHAPGSGLTSSGPNTSNPTTSLEGVGSGYSGNNRDRGIVDGSAAVVGTGLVASEAKHATFGDGTTGSGYNPSHNNTYSSSNADAGSGLSGGSNFATDRSTAGSGLTGTDTSRGYGSNTTGTGSASGYGSTSSSRELGSGLDGVGSTSTSTAPGSGLGVTGSSDHGSAGSRSGPGAKVADTTNLSSGVGSQEHHHHRGDGHEEDILHPGPHVTQTAKALDPHLH